MKNPNPDEPCWCDSGYAYQKCHMRIDGYPDDKRLLGARTLYSEMWDRNATNIEAQSGYEWMASLLRPYNPVRILDIGCGTGNGLVALYKQFPTAKIVSVDENPQIIAVAKARLMNLGADVNVICRLKDRSTGSRSHSLSFDAGKLRLTRGVDLIESDILEDREMDSCLAVQKKFDAITVWLIGSHILRYHECDSHRGKINSPNEYRLHVHAVACALASRFLRPGGVLQLVDRGPVPATDEKKNALLVMPELLASQTRGALKVKGLAYFPYSETSPDKAIKMVTSSGKLVDPSDLALISILFERQDLQKRRR